MLGSELANLGRGLTIVIPSPEKFLYFPVPPTNFPFLIPSGAGKTESI